MPCWFVMGRARTSPGRVGDCAPEPDRRIMAPEPMAGESESIRFRGDATGSLSETRTHARSPSSANVLAPREGATSTRLSTHEKSASPATRASTLARGLTLGLGDDADIAGCVAETSRMQQAMSRSVEPADPLRGRGGASIRW